MRTFRIKPCYATTAVLVACAAAKPLGIPASLAVASAVMLAVIPFIAWEPRPTAAGNSRCSGGRI